MNQPTYERVAPLTFYGYTIQDIEELKQQRDILLAALFTLKQFEFCDGNCEHLDIIDKAIAKVTK